MHKKKTKIKRKKNQTNQASSTILKSIRWKKRAKAVSARLRGPSALSWAGGCWAGKFLTWHCAGKTPSKGITWDREREGWDRKYAPAVSQKATVQHSPESPVQSAAMTTHSFGETPYMSPMPLHTCLIPQPICGAVGIPHTLAWRKHWAALCLGWELTWAPWPELLPEIPSAEQTELRHSVTPLLNSSAQFI